MEEIILEAQARKEIGGGRVGRLRRRALIPAVVYGEGRESQAIEIGTRDFVNLVGLHHGGTFVLKLRIKEGSKHSDLSVLIKEMQHDPVNGSIIHVDFNEVSLTKVIRVKVPIAAKGEPIGVKQDGGVLDHVLWELEVECLPTSIPESIEVDVSGLKIGDSIHVRDLKIPAGIKVLSEIEAVVLAVSMPKQEEIASAAAEEVAGEEKVEPEVIKEKKDKAEGAAEAAEGKSEK